MASVQIVHLEGAPNYCPVTHFYRADDGLCFAVSVKDPEALADIFSDFAGTTIRSHVPPGVDVFLCDERGAAVDADGNPINGLTAYASTDLESFAVHKLPDSVTTHSEALAALGYTLTETETS